MKSPLGIDTNGDTVSQPTVNEQLPTPSPTPEPEGRRITLPDNGVQALPFTDTDASEPPHPVVGKGAHWIPQSDGAVEGKLPLQTEDTKEKRRGSIGRLGSPTTDKVLKLSPAKIQELTASPTSLPLRPATPILEDVSPLPTSPVSGLQERTLKVRGDGTRSVGGHSGRPEVDETETRASSAASKNEQRVAEASTVGGPLAVSRPTRPNLSSRAVSTPVVTRRKRSSSKAQGGAPDREDHGPGRTLPPLSLKGLKESALSGSADLKPSPIPESAGSPMPTSLPVPPLSIATYLQLELSSDRPSPLYIHRSATADIPYENSKIKFERLYNFLRLPPQLEQILWFGALACLDAWLYTFTVLPLRFLKAVWLIVQYWVRAVTREARDIGFYIYRGLGRLWHRCRRKRHDSVPGAPSAAGTEPARASLSNPVVPRATSDERANGSASCTPPEQVRKSKTSSVYRSRRTKSTPSALQPAHKADILRGLLVIATCAILMRFDASRMYHSVRGQAAIKLYVIYNVLEVGDRLFAALGQDIMECLLSPETLERNAEGRSKVIRPFWMFLLALAYNVLHATALFYQVITLNVAVNSYSNALLTLLMSNQFVEIKSTVFKKFEKENLFQLTCADVVERFQLWLMLMIIAMRNVAEVGGLSISLQNILGSSSSSAAASNATSIPLSSGNIIPKSFTILPRWTGEVLGPFLLVLGSEMLVDWLKHAYINKFNNVKPNIYGRFLDVMAKDYYSHAFADQNLTKRLGLPVLPLACLFIRASLQTYHMFLATHMPPPLPSTATSISIDSAAPTLPVTTAALAHIDQIFRRALGRSSFGAGADAAGGNSFSWWSLDDVIAFATMLVVFLVAYLLLLAFKLVLGMCLLGFARSRYKSMKEREKGVVDTAGRRVGGWGVVEVDEDKRRWIYADDAEGLRALRERDGKAKEKAGKGDIRLEGVERYAMVAKRIW